MRTDREIAQDIAKHFSDSRRRTLIISGPTASGKSSVVDEIAALVGGHIINCDSMQIYKEFPVITAQPDFKKLSENGISHSLYGFYSIFDERFSVAKWLSMAKEQIDYAISSGLVPILVGGSGMYISSLIYGFTDLPEVPVSFSEKVAERVDFAIKMEDRNLVFNREIEYPCDLRGKMSGLDRNRTIRELSVFEFTGTPLSRWHKTDKNQGDLTKYEADFFTVIIKAGRHVIVNRIAQRFAVSELDMIAEVGAVLKEHGEKKVKENCYKVIGVSAIASYILGRLNREEMQKEILCRTRQYAKRQMTWFRNKMAFDMEVEKHY